MHNLILLCFLGYMIKIVGVYDQLYQNTGVLMVHNVMYSYTHHGVWTRSCLDFSPLQIIPFTNPIKFLKFPSAFILSALKCSLKHVGRELYILKDKSKERADHHETARCFQTTNKATLSADMV